MQNSHEAARVDHTQFSRLARIGVLVAVGSVMSAGKLVSQGVSSGSYSIRPLVGAYLPTGDQRDFLKDALLVGVQGTWNAAPYVALTGNFGWAPSKDKITAGDQKIDAFQYDLGVELRSPVVDLGPVAPFVGAGVGGRTYSYRDLDVDSKTNFDGYGALGLEASFGVLNARLEGRDYISRFKPLTGNGSAKTRNDVALFAGVGVSF